MRFKFAARLFPFAAVLFGCSALASGACTRPTASDATTLTARLAAPDARLAARLAGAGERGFSSSSDGTFVSEGYRISRTKDFSKLSARVVPSDHLSTELAPGRLSSLRVSLKARGARASEGHLADGRVVVADAFPSTDALWASGDHALEHALLLRDANAPRRFEWDVELGEDVVAAERRGGGLVFVDRRGEAVLAVPAPFVLDGVGTRHEAQLDWDAEHHRLAVSLLGEPSFPALLDPSFETEVWTTVAQPPVDGSPVAAFDDARGQLVVVAGAPDATVHTWNGSVWRRRSNPPRGDMVGSVMGYDPERKVVLLVTPFGTTWQWDGTTWTASPSPPLLRDSQMVFDSTRRTMVLHGGFTLDGRISSATWIWDGSKWSAYQGSVPPARYGSVLIEDRKRQRIVLTGADQNFKASTWLWDGSSWTEAAGPSPAVWGAAAGYDDVRHEIVLFGGTGAGNTPSSDTWTWAGAWTKRTTTRTPPARSGQPLTSLRISLTFDAARGNMLLFGGALEDGVVWTWNGTDWVDQRVPTPPTGRYNHALIYDPARAEVVLHGGTTTTEVNDTWTWNGARWSPTYALEPQLGRAAGPVQGGLLVAELGRNSSLLWGGGLSQTETWSWDGRMWSAGPALPLLALPGDGAVAVYDPERRATLLTGGTRTNGTAPNTFVWDGTTWTSPPGPGPSRRAGHAVAFDPARKNVVLYGGGPIGIGNFLSDTWLWDGSVWSQSMATGPGPRKGHSMVYDPSRAEVLLVGGSASTDTWAWNGAAWTQRATGTPPPRQDAVLVADVARNTIVLFGGVAAGYRLNDTWIWNGSAWRSITGPAPPSFPEQRATYDSRRRRVVLQLEAPGAAQTWTFDGTRWWPAADPLEPRLTADETVKGFVYDPIKGEHVLKTTSSTLLLRTRGGDCTSGAECASGHCVDGVCCEAISCGTCQTCAGQDPGRCTNIILEEDPDTCAAAQRRGCDRNARCGNGLGSTCSAASDCASGFCAKEAPDKPGTCCNEACTLACQSCFEATKVQGPDGTCGPSARGTNPGGRCALGTCDRGACVVGSTCREDRYATTVDDTIKDCSPFKCSVGRCLDRCVSVNDCVSPATCSPDGLCQVVNPQEGDGGCIVALPGETSFTRTFGAFAAILAFGTMVRRRLSR